MEMEKFEYRFELATDWDWDWRMDARLGNLFDSKIGKR